MKEFVSTLYRRFRHLIHEGAKFCVVGGIGALVTLGGADILYGHLGVNKYLALTVATLAATIVTFVGNRYWTFRSRSGRGTSHESVMFFLLNAVGLFIGYACIWLVTDAAGRPGHLWYDLANFIGLVLGTLFRFWSYRKWVWRARPAAGAAAPAASAGLAAAPVPAGQPSGNGHASGEAELVAPLRPAPAPHHHTVRIAHPLPAPQPVPATQPVPGQPGTRSAR